MTQRKRHNPTKRRRAIAGRSACAVFALMATASVTWASSVRVVISADRDHYRLASDRATQSLERAGHDVEVVTLESLSDDELATADVHVAVGNQAASRLAETLPEGRTLRYCLTSDPEAVGLTDREGTAGLSGFVSVEDQLAYIREVLPKASRLGVLYRSSSKRSIASLEDAREALPRGIEVVAIDLDDEGFDSDMEGIRELLASDIDLVWSMPDSAVYNRAIVKSLLVESLRRRVPVFGFSVPVVRAGALFGVGIDPALQGTRVAEMIEQRHSGQHLTASPVFAINLTVAERIGVTIPKSVIRDADEVFGERE